MISLAKFVPDAYLLMATRRGEIKKTLVTNFASVRSNGLIAMDLNTGDELVSATIAGEADDVLLVTEQGQSIRFPIAELRTLSRTSGGVRGVRLVPKDQVVSMDIVRKDAYVLSVSALGFGKLTPATSYPRQHRGGVGVRTFRITDKTGRLSAAKVVLLIQEAMIISAEGIVIQTPVREKDPRQGITIQGRSTQGVRLMRVDPGDEVVAIACFDKELK
jgi:DNA gyrase subunit A